MDMFIHFLLEEKFNRKWIHHNQRHQSLVLVELFLDGDKTSESRQYLSSVPDSIKKQHQLHRQGRSGVSTGV